MTNTALIMWRGDNDKEPSAFVVVENIPEHTLIHDVAYWYAKVYGFLPHTISASWIDKVSMRGVSPEELRKFKEKEATKQPTKPDYENREES